jgi:hypothetical protein
MPACQIAGAFEAESHNPLILVARLQTGNFFTPPPPSLRSEPYLVWKSSLRNLRITSEFEMFQLLILGSCNSTRYNLLSIARLAQEDRSLWRSQTGRILSVDSKAPSTQVSSRNRRLKQLQEHPEWRTKTSPYLVGMYVGIYPEALAENILQISQQPSSPRMAEGHVESRTENIIAVLRCSPASTP